MRLAALLLLLVPTCLAERSLEASPDEESARPVDSTCTATYPEDEEAGAMTVQMLQSRVRRAEQVSLEASGEGATSSQNDTTVDRLSRPKRKKEDTHEFAKPLDDPRLVQLLAACAADVYNLTGEWLGQGHLQLLKSQLQDDETTGKLKALQYGLFNITENSEHQGKKILAFRGTDSRKGLLQDVALVLDHEYFARTKRRAVETARIHGADFLTGHSLGAAIAEAAASELHLGGASFNGPGVCHTEASKSYCSPGSRDFHFDVYLTFKDPVSLHGGKSISHLAQPDWLRTPENPHKMSMMINTHFGRLT